jgi:hypothetical protein
VHIFIVQARNKQVYSDTLVKGFFYGFEVLLITTALKYPVTNSTLMQYKLLSKYRVLLFDTQAAVCSKDQRQLTGCLLHCTLHYKYVQSRAGIAIRILNRHPTVLWVIVSPSGRLILYPTKKPALSLG